MQKQRKGRQETVVQWWGSVLVPPEGIYLTIWYIALSSSTGTKPPTQVEDGNFRLCTGTWTLGYLKPEGWWLRLLGHHPVASPPTNQRRVTHPADLLPKFFLATDDYSEAILVILKIPFVIKSKNFYLAECLGLLGHYKNSLLRSEQ